MEGIYPKWKTEYYKHLEGSTLEDMFARYVMAAIQWKTATDSKQRDRVLWKLTVLEDLISPRLKPLQQYIDENDALKKRGERVEKNQERQIEELKKKIKEHELEKD
jgi:hypothetical protein